MTSRAASPLYPGNHDLAATRRRGHRRLPSGRPWLPQLRARVVPDAEPVFVPIISRAEAGACVAVTTRRQRKASGHLVLCALRRGDRDA